MSGAAPRRRVAVLGLDCVPPLILFDRLAGELPNLASLMRRGAYGPLESTIPPITVPAWMSMMSSKDPGTLGIYGFRNRKSHGYDDLGIVTSRWVREPKVWDLIAARGKRSVLLGVPPAFPAVPVQGISIGCFLTPGLSSHCTWPPELGSELQTLEPNYLFDVPFRTEDRDGLLENLYEMTRQHWNVARHMAATRDWDFFMMVEIGTDRLHHAFWKFFDERHRLHEPGHRFAGAIPDYYRFLDRQIGSLLEVFPEETSVFVVSDHGARPLDGCVAVNEWLREKGYLHLKESPATPTRITPAMIDWGRTRVWGEGGYYARIFLNVAGREPEGTVRPDEVPDLVGRLTAELEAMLDPEGRPLGNRVFVPARIYERCNGVPPDLIVYFGDLAWRSVGSVGYAGGWHVFENDAGPDDANHDPDGILIAAGPGIPNAGLTGGLSLYDVAPTLLHLFGLPPPPGARGAVKLVGP